MKISFLLYKNVLFQLNVYTLSTPIINENLNLYEHILEKYSQKHKNNEKQIMWIILLKNNLQVKKKIYIIIIEKNCRIYSTRYLPILNNYLITALTLIN